MVSDGPRHPRVGVAGLSKLDHVLTRGATRTDRHASATGHPTDKIATDKALFSITVRNTTNRVAGLAGAHAADAPFD